MAKGTLTTVLTLAIMLAGSGIHGARGADAPSPHAPRSIDVAFEPVDVDSAYQKRATWQETLRAAFETLRNDHPSLCLGRCQVNDKWFRAGPYAWPTGKGPSDVVFDIPLTGVDLVAKRPDGTRIWMFEGPVNAGQPYDLELPARSAL